MKMTSALPTTVSGSLARIAPLADREAISPEIVTMADGKVVSWELRSHPCTVYVVSGSVWLTTEHSSEDFLLAEGESLTLSAPGKVVAQSLLGSATIALLRS